MSDKTTEAIYTELETPVIRCKDCGGTVIYKRTIEGFEIIHSCANGKQVRKQIATAERRTTDALASLKWAVYALEHGTSVEVHWLKHVAREPYQKALAVIAELEASEPEGRK